MRHGIILVDKPSGPTSHDIVEMARHVLGVRQIGHTGTLDPLATGLLLLGVREGTKLTPFLSDLDKSYECTAHLGARSTTYDAMGAIEPAADRTRLAQLDRPEIEEAIAFFRGAIEQRPPAFSAAKVDGRPMYDYARWGEEVEARARRVRVYEFEIVEFNPFADGAAQELPIRLHFRVSSGTYIRSLAHDLGERLGVGGYVAQLRRTAIGPFNVSNAVDLAAGATAADFEKGWRSLAQALGHWTTVRAPDALVAGIGNGATIAAAGLAVSKLPLESDHLYVLLDTRDRLLAVARCLVSRGEGPIFGGGGRRGELVLKPVRVFNDER